MKAPLSLASVALLGLLLAASQDAPKPAQPAGTPAADGVQDAAARDLLAAMAKTYAECTSYRDSGTVIDTWVGRDQTSTVAFKTTFVRGGSFRFEHVSPEHDGVGKPYIVWTDGKVVRTWWPLKPPHVREESSLEMGIAGATGISMGAALMIPRLLFPDAIRAWALTDVIDPKVEGEEAIDDKPCVKIAGADGRGGQRTIWLDKQSHLVRKLFVSHPFPDRGYTGETTTTYQPELNPAIDPAELEFNPPQDEAEAPK